MSGFRSNEKHDAFYWSKEKNCKTLLVEVQKRDFALNCTDHERYFVSVCP